MDIGFYSYLIAALAYSFLSVLLFTSWRGGLQGAFLISATLVTAVWAVVVGIQSRFEFFFNPRGANFGSLSHLRLANLSLQGVNSAVVS